MLRKKPFAVITAAGRRNKPSRAPLCGYETSIKYRNKKKNRNKRKARQKAIKEQQMSRFSQEKHEVLAVMAKMRAHPILGSLMFGDDRGYRTEEPEAIDEFDEFKKLQKEWEEPEEPEDAEEELDF